MLGLGFGVTVFAQERVHRTVKCFREPCEKVRRFLQYLIEECFIPTCTAAWRYGAARKSAKHCVLTVQVGCDTDRMRIYTQVNM